MKINEYAKKKAYKPYKLLFTVSTTAKTLKGQVKAILREDKTFFDEIGTYNKEDYLYKLIKNGFVEVLDDGLAILYDGV